MTATPPLFSIVIPTRNRANLLPYALESALDQKFSDYEIVVSDNHSDDATQSVVAERGASRVRYVRTNRVLSMPDHWEFALNHARGAYITYLCDDDALSGDALETASNVISKSDPALVVIGTALYWGGNWYQSDLRNHHMVLSNSGRVIDRTSGEGLDILSKCQNTYDIPRMLNSFCRREVLSSARRKYGRVFLLCPDYSFPALVLPSTPGWVHVDWPLRVQGIFAEGIGATQAHNRGAPSKEFVREFSRATLLEHTPLAIPVVTNYIAETLLLSKKLASDGLRNFEVDWVHYFVGCWNDLAVHESNGVDVEQDKLEFERVLAEQSPDVRRRVTQTLSQRQAGADPSLGNTVAGPIARMRRLGGNVRRKLRLPPADKSTPTFLDILDCVRQLPSLNSSSGLGPL